MSDLDVQAESSDGRATLSEHNQALGANELLIGTVVSFDSQGRPQVAYRMGSEQFTHAALATVSLHASAIGRQVAIMFVAQDPEQPIVIGLIKSRLDDLLDILEPKEFELKQDDIGESADHSSRIDQRNIERSIERNIERNDDKDAQQRAEQVGDLVDPQTAQQRNEQAESRSEKKIGHAEQDTRVMDLNPQANGLGESSQNLSIDGKRISIEGQEEIVLKCGESSITLTKSGKILIRGKYLLNRSTGVNRIMGGSVQVN